MKIAVSAQGNTPESKVDERFGRAQGFIIYDEGTFSYIDNVQNYQAMQGAGIQSAKTVVDSGAKVVITGHVGPKAFSVLQKAGVEIYLATGLSIKDTIEEYKKGSLQKAGGADVESHW